MLKIGTWSNTKNTQFSMLSEEITGPEIRQFIIQQPTISKKTQTGLKNVHVSLGPLKQRMLPPEKLIEVQEKTIRNVRTLNS